MTQPARKASAEPAAQSNVAEFTVSELSGAVKRALEDGFGFVRLRGEISGYRGPHASGHCYFALKDDKAKIEAVIWKGSFQRLRFKPAEGMEVIAQGRVTTYPGSSKYQIVIETLEPAGVGALMALLEERKRKLAAEGLFAEEKKRKLPFLPRVVGIVTSPTGAVIRDMLHGFDERFPTHVVVWPVRVQGETSAVEVAAAIRGFNALPPAGGPVPRPDVLIVARGGGSLEDLWGFNEEIVVRAAAESAIPLISAVGHETDWTLIDLAADARAPTPTKAAEWAVPKRSDLVEAVGERGQRLFRAIRQKVDADRAEWRAAARGLPRPRDLVALPRQGLDSLSGRLAPRLLRDRLGRLGDRLESTRARGREALSRSTAQRRARYERFAGRLGPDVTRVRLKSAGDRLADTGRRIGSALQQRLATLASGLDAQAKLLRSLSYQSVLQRGFAVVRDAEGRAVRSVGAVAAGDRLSVEVADGRFEVEAQAGDASPTAPRPRPAPRTPGRGGQGSLF
ncbi:MAG: exodeoxyribonuclease VII large subunit [Hyphomicrobiaceae bacterium]